MKDQGVSNVEYGSFLLTFLLFFAVAELNAQSGRPISTVERRIDTLNRQSETFEKENMGRSVKGNRAERAEAARQKQIHIEEDLNTLQDAYNKILVTLHKAKDVDPQFAENVAVDVRKHAVRLRSNLALGKDEDEETNKEGRYSTSASDRLKVLTRLLYEFVTNPIFENMGTIDVKQSRKASKDLDEIIEVAQGLAGSK